ncbi:MAG: DUF1638 domain-containing protein [Clostridiales bacterium]|nr:DUF1638 domain-containing protein [Clostridiales bacterium]
MKRYKLIACEIMFREVSLAAAHSKNIIDITFMPKGLHDIGECKMGEELQDAINQVESDKYDAILLCYGLCNNGTVGLHADIPIVIPKAHDCITLLLGSKETYNDYFYKNPGTFFKSSGWIERDTNPNETEGSTTSQLGMNKTYQEYVEQFGEENAKYLMEMLGDWFKNYKKLAYINTGTGNIELNKKQSMELAQEYDWEYEEVQGSTQLIRKLVDGDWDDDAFVVIPPDSQIIATNDTEILSYSE